MIRLKSAYYDLAVIGLGFGVDIGLAIQNDECAVGSLALVEDDLAFLVSLQLAGERKQLELGLLELSEQRHFAERLRFPLDVHVFLVSSLVLLLSASRNQLVQHRTRPVEFGERTLFQELPAFQDNRMIELFSKTGTVH